MKYRIRFKALDKKEYLYHATFKKFLPSIQRSGLGNKNRILWDESKRNKIYFATDPDTARSYAEVALDFPSNSDLNEDDIIILRVDTLKLDKTKLSLDENVIDNDGSTLEYQGIVPYADLSIYRGN